MSSPTRFTVLIDKRLTPLRPVLLWSVLLLAAFALLLGMQPAQARDDGQRGRVTKIARDLQGELASVRKSRERWVREVGGKRHVQLIVIGDGPDPELTALRAEVLRLGGSVRARHALVRGLTVQLPADKVAQLAARDDVASISPNRQVRRTASLLEASTGALTGNVRSYGYGSYSGLDGSGVGIAVLDSGVMRAHRSFQDAGGMSRVTHNVNLLNARLSDWLTGVDNSISPAPGSAALASYESLINSTSSPVQDPYGHGTHVAAVAAGRGFYQFPDSTGVAPGAQLFDVRVLGDDGTGSVSDVLEGIQWVIFHAREYNIRVLNISLSAASTESWQTDPLCIAARRATAAGIAVVVAAGNFGLTADGRQAYGTIGSPGNDPSVITVGAANHKATLARDDDSVNHFSSRGPTRGAMTVDGVRRIDNLLKPDLVAPGNRVVAAAATRANWMNPQWNLLAQSNPDLLTAASAAQTYGQTLMMLSGTSIAAPCRFGRRGADAAGQPRPDAADGEGHPAVQRAAAGQAPTCCSRAPAC